MANSNWHRGKAKGRAQAKAWLRHNDKERRKDPQVNHKNRDIDKSRTDRNFEVGPTAGMTYEEKCARLDAALDKWGYPTDGDLGTVNSRTPSCMQGIVVYAPDALDNDEAETDGRLAAWFEKAADEACEQFGEENVIAAYVDVDEVHDYTDARTGETRTSKRHMHLYVVPVCEVKQTARTPLYVRPDGTETENADEAQQVYITVNNAETDDASKAAKNDDGTPKTGPKCARLKSGRRKYKRQKRGEAATSKLMLRGSEFSSTENVTRFNKAVHDMTVREFGVPWNTHEPGTYQRNDGDEDRSVEELKAASVEREVAQRRAEAAAEIEQNLAQSEALLDEADIDRMRAECERNGAVFYVRHGERMMAPLPRIKDDEDPSEFAAIIDRSFPVGDDLTAEGLGRIVEVRYAPLVVQALAERDAKATRETAEADAERKRADVAEREQLLDERVALVNEHEDAVLRREDDVRRREDAVAEREAEATRLLDGYDREATIADFMPQLPPDADEGERAAADERARKAFAGACFRNGLKPPTVHVPGVRERDAELTRQEQELVPLLKAVRAFIEDPVTFVADALRRVQGYIAEVAHSEGTTRSQRLTNEMMNDAIADATRLMYAHPGDPRMREACAPDAPALREDERSGPVFDVDAWAEERRRKRAAKSAAKMTRQTLQQRLTQQPEQQSVREVWPESYAPKPRRGYDGPEL